jgi:class 3 adenylate cyclase
VRRFLGRLLLLAALAGGVVAARGYLKGQTTGEEVVQIVFDDGSTHTLLSNTVEAQELTDIARKVVEIGI